jgi:AAA15 family ATPase/GTPase
MLISRIEIENLLSFKSLDLELRPLNVLVGPNASGKSKKEPINSLWATYPD